MNYANIKFYDISNGLGVRTSLFVSGCRRHCKNCFNAMTWDFHYGEEFTEEVEQKILDSLKPGYIHGLTVLGGEPFEPENQAGLLPFLKRVRAELPDKSIWIFSGNTWEEITAGKAHCDVTDELLQQTDVLIDGPFVEELYDIRLRFRGSSNQRILDVPRSLAAGAPVLWEE